MWDRQIFSVNCKYECLPCAPEVFMEAGRPLTARGGLKEVISQLIVKVLLSVKELQTRFDLPRF